MYDYENEYFQDIQKRREKNALQELISALKRNFPNLGELNVLLITKRENPANSIKEIVKHITNIPPKDAMAYFNNTNCSDYNLLLFFNTHREIVEAVVNISKQYDIPFFGVQCNCIKCVGPLLEEGLNNLCSELRKVIPEVILYTDKDTIGYLSNFSVKK